MMLMILQAILRAVDVYMQRMEDTEDPTPADDHAELVSLRNKVLDAEQIALKKTYG